MAMSSSRTRAGSAPSTSHFVNATTYRHSAAMMCAAASLVWGITPSSAAHTSTATSVTLAPRLRIALKAACPGVSRKVSSPPPEHRTTKAPRCWVMPPASPAATDVDRSASNRVVLPWSTWPMTATTARRGGWSAEVSAWAETPTTLASRPNSAATSSRTSASRGSSTLRGESRPGPRRSSRRGRVGRRAGARTRRWWFPRRRRPRAGRAGVWVSVGGSGGRDREILLASSACGR